MSDFQTLWESEFRQWIQRRTFLHPDFNRFNMWKECTSYWKQCEQTNLRSRSNGSYFVIHDWWQPFLYQEINIFQDRNKVVNIKIFCAILKRNFAQSKDPEKQKKFEPSENLVKSKSWNPWNRKKSRKIDIYQNKIIFC